MSSSHVARCTSIVEREHGDAARWLQDSDEREAAAVVLPSAPTYE
jgi:hypothetical protein